MATRKLDLKAGDVAYVSLPGHRHEHGSVSKMVNLDDLMPDYHGPRIHFDFDADGQLLGIEILVPSRPGASN
jgi:hypothetical protein